MKLAMFFGDATGAAGATARASILVLLPLPLMKPTQKNGGQTIVFTKMWYNHHNRYSLNNRQENSTPSPDSLQMRIVLTRCHIRRSRMHKVWLNSPASTGGITGS